MRFCSQSTVELMLLGTILVAGCAEAPAVSVAPAERQKFIINTEPAGASTIADAKAALTAQAGELVLVGQILAGQFDPFESDRATFVLTELPEEGHGTGHDSANCPFCKRRAAKAPKVVVQCVDEAGEVLPIGAQKLLGVEPNQVIVVRGEGQLNPDLDLFTVQAKSIYIRR